MADRFEGAIAGIGSTSGVRVVVGRWQRSPFGAFVDAMVERSDGHRILIAPAQNIADYVAQTYTFDEIRIETIEVVQDPGGPANRPDSWRVISASLRVSIEVGARLPLGYLLAAVPKTLAAAPAWARAISPVARVVMPGVRTVGTAREGRIEYYGATDLRAIAAMSGQLDGIPLGELAPVDPPCRFGFSSTPRTPSVTAVVTTIRR